MGPGQKTRLAPPSSNLGFSGSKCTVLKKKLAILLGIFGAPSFWRQVHFASLVPLVTPLVWHFATNRAAVKFAEAWMSNHLSKLRYHSYVSSAMYPECPTKDWRGTSCWLNPRESGPEVVQGPRGVTASFGTVLVWGQQNYLKLLLTVRYSKSA